MVTVGQFLVVADTIVEALPSRFTAPAPGAPATTRRRRNGGEMAARLS